MLLLVQLTRISWIPCRWGTYWEPTATRKCNTSYQMSSVDIKCIKLVWEPTFIARTVSTKYYLHF